MLFEIINIKVIINYHSLYIKNFVNYLVIKNENKLMLSNKDHLHKHHFAFQILPCTEVQTIQLCYDTPLTYHYMRLFHIHLCLFNCNSLII